MVLEIEFFFAPDPALDEACTQYNARTGENLTPQDFLPKKGEPLATGADVRCAEPNGIILRPGCYMLISLGFRMFAPSGWWLELRPRSGTFAKRQIHALYGVIDETYENKLMFAGQYIPNSCDLLSADVEKKIEFGERIAQVIPVARKNLAVTGVSNEQLDAMFAARNAARGTGGFNSTGSR